MHRWRNAVALSWQPFFFPLSLLVCSIVVSPLDIHVLARQRSQNGAGQYARTVGSSPGVGWLIDQSGDTGEGSNIEAPSVERNFRLHFQLSGWAFMALSYFED